MHKGINNKMMNPTQSHTNNTHVGQCDIIWNSVLSAQPGRIL